MKEFFLAVLAQWPAFLLNLVIFIMAAAIVFGAKRGWQYKHLSEFTLAQKVGAISWVFLCLTCFCIVTLLYIHITRCGLNFMLCEVSVQPYARLVLALMMIFVVLACAAVYAEYLLERKERCVAKEG